MEPKSITYYAAVMGMLVAMAAPAFSNVAPSATAEESQNDNINTENNGVKDFGLDISKPGSGAPACGVVITEDISLNEDLACDGNGLIVGAKDVTINLNGHTIRSDGEGDAVDLTVNYGDNNGILVPNANNVEIIGPGQISGFDRAITFTGSTGGIVTDIVLRDNKAAILIAGSSEVSVTTNTIDNNKFGIVSESSQESQIIFNLIAANEEQGIVLSDSDEYIVIGNTVFGNGENGVFLDAQSFENYVDLNNVFGHENADINNANGLPVNINRNSFGEENNCAVSLPGGLC